MEIIHKRYRGKSAPGKKPDVLSDEQMDVRGLYCAKEFIGELISDPRVRSLFNSVFQGHGSSSPEYKSFLGFIRKVRTSNPLELELYGIEYYRLVVLNSSCREEIEEEEEE